MKLQSWTPLQGFRGHVKGSGLDISSGLKQGENILAFELERNEKGCFGLMLRGEILLNSGEKIPLVSSASQFKASGTGAPGWNLPGFDDSSWLPAWEQGDVLMAPWITYGDVPRIYCSPDEYASRVAFCTQGFPAEKIAGEPETPSIRVVYNNHIPGVEINGTVFPFFIWSTCEAFDNPQRDNMIEKAGKAGVPFFAISVSSPCFQVQKTGEYDLTELNLGICRLLAIHPDAFIILYFKGDPMEWWIKENPDELVGYAVKSTNIDWGNYSANPQVTSFASKKYRAEIARNLQQIADYCLKQPWGRRIVGVMTGYGGSGDGMPWGAHSMPDTGKRMTEAFQSYLLETYPSDEALQKSWDDSTVTRAAAAVPDAIQRQGSGHYLRNPADSKDRRVLDYYNCYHREFADYMIDWGKSVKSAFPGRLAGTYFGYIVLSYTPEGSTANVERVLQSPCIDFMFATTRGYNLTDGLHRHLHSIFHRYGKISSIEADIRTHIGKGIAEEQWLCKTPEETRSTVSKVIGNSFFYGSGFHIVDFGSNIRYFNCPEALEPITEGVKLWKRFFHFPPRMASDIAVIIDPAQIWRQGHPEYRKTNPFADMLVTFPMQSLNFSGFSNDWMALEDYLKSQHDYRVVIFLNTFEISPDQQSALLKKLRRPGMTAIWNYAPGIIGANGFSEQSMKELTGLDLRLQTDAKPFVTAGRARQLPAASAWSDSPRVFCANQDIEVLAKYSDDATPSLVRKKLPDGSTAIFAGIPIHSTELWAELLQHAGCHAFTPPGFYVRKNSGLLQVFAMPNGTIPPESSILQGQVDQSGLLPVTLEKKANRVIDLFTGEIFCSDSDKFILKTKLPRLWLLEITEK